MKNTLFPALLAALILLFPSWRTDAQVMLEKAVISGGAVRASNTTTTDDLTLGEPIIGYASNGTINESFGFWHQAFVASSVAERAGAGAIMALQVTPNPVMDMASIGVRLARSGHVDVTLHDQAGRQVTTLFSGQHAAGELRMPFDPAGLPSGTYHIAVRSHGALLQASITILRWFRGYGW